MKYYGFVKVTFPATQYALLSELDRESYETYVRVCVLNDLKYLSSETLNKSKSMLLNGQLGHCYDLIFWASGGLFWSKSLTEARSKGFNGVEEFNMNVWEKIDDYNYVSVKDITFQGVKWKDVGHSETNGGSSDCWGYAIFDFTQIEKNSHYVRMECSIPKEIKYPVLNLGENLYQYAVEK